MGLFSTFFKFQAAPELIQTKAVSAPVYYPITGHGGVNWLTDNATQYVNAYLTNNNVTSIVKQITDKVAAVPFYLYEVEKTKQKDFKRYKSFSTSNNLLSVEAFKCKSSSMKEVDSHVIMDILDQPNPKQGWSDFVKEATGYKLITGNSYIFGTKPADFSPNKNKIIGLSILPSQLMNIVTSANGDVDYFHLAGSNERWPKENILHLKYWNPDYSSANNQYGMSPLRSGLRVIALNNEAYKSQAEILANKGAHGFLGANEAVGQEVLDELKARFQTAKNGEILVTSQPMTWTQIAQPADELQILESMDINLRDLCNLYGFPSLLLGNTQDKTYSNYETAVKSMIFNCVVPLLTELRDNLNKWLVPAYSKADGVQYYIDYDITVLPELATDMDKLVAQLDKQWYLTPNEKRAAVKYGTLPDPAMDKVYIASGLQPIDEASISINTDLNQDLSDYQ
jgi:HK97 family phage portal protein